MIGIVLYMGKNEKRKGVGTIMLGFMALMTGMDIMGDSMEFLESEPWFAQIMISFWRTDCHTSVRTGSQ